MRPVVLTYHCFSRKCAQKCISRTDTNYTVLSVNL